MADSNRAVYAALAGNVAIAITKFIAALVTGSSAMLSEAFHSTADSGDSLLLLFGRARSKRPPDEHHPFGHGQELYFYTLIVSILIFAVGGGASAFEGVTHVLHPEPARNLLWSYAVLGIAAIFEGSSLFIGFRQFRSEFHGESVWRAARTSKDPTTFTVVFEDSAALLGLAVAFLGIWLGEHFHKPVLDGIASIVIGAILMIVAVLLARESKGLLVGEAADAEILESVSKLARSEPAVERINPPLTMHFGPNAILLAMEVQFRRGLSSSEVTAAIDRIESSIRQRHPKVRQIFVEAESISAPARQDRVA